MKTIVVNGANGYVASNFITSLLKQKFKVIALVRSTKTCSAEERMQNILEELNDEKIVYQENLKVYDYSLLHKDFDLNAEQLHQIFTDDVDYFHFAASLKFDEKSVDEIFATNVDGVKNSIDVFLENATGNSRFFYIGTAYSCGKYDAIFEEKFYEDEDISSFRNYYELSKRYGENVVRKRIEKDNLNGYVIRLSQVVGDNRTGVTKTDYGIFDFTKRVYNLACRYPDQVVRVHVDPASTQNLIPINTVVKYLSKIVKSDNVPQIMNFVSTRPTFNKSIINTLNETLPIKLIPLEKLDRSSMNEIERLIAIGMSFTGSYTRTNLRFDTSLRDKILTLKAEDELSEENIKTMLKYFIVSLNAKNGKQFRPETIRNYLFLNNMNQ